MLITKHDRIYPKLDITDKDMEIIRLRDLIGRAIRNRPRPIFGELVGESEPWHGIKKMFSLTDGEALALCREFGIDPETGEALDKEGEG